MTRRNSLRLPAKQTALLSAALRHARDAEHLLDAGAGYTSPDQAYHLGGYGPECARKATLSIRWLDQAVGHGAGAAAEDILEFAMAMQDRARWKRGSGRCSSLSGRSSSQTTS